MTDDARERPGRRPVRDRGEKRPRPGRPPKLSPEEDAAQRGEDPPDAIDAPAIPTFPDEDPKWVPDPAEAERWRELIQEHGRERRPNREDVLPYLLIRGHAPGDRAKRPLWPPIPSWLSPDIVLVDGAWTGAFRPDKVVTNPVAGRTYRVFVHAWNLGLLAAVGVHVRAWYVDPGFFSGAPGVVPTLIGGAFTDLAPRTGAGAHQLVEIQPPWSIPASLSGHECLLAAVDCPADRWNGVFDANADRHVGQRNITILAGGATLIPLLRLLGDALAPGAFLEITLTMTAGGEPLRYGVPIDNGRHLFTATRLGEHGEAGGLAVVPTTRLADWLGEQAPDLSRPGMASRMFAGFVRQMGRELGNLADESLEDALGGMLDERELTAERVLGALHARGDLALNLAVFGPEGEPTGGYTIALAAEQRPER